MKRLIGFLFGGGERRDPPPPKPGTASTPSPLMVLDGVAIDEIGRADDACPSCGVVLAKRPARKAGCPHCHEPMHVRVRPLDGVRVLIKAADLPDLDRQWAAFQDLKAIVRMLAYSSAEAETIFQDLHTGRRGRTPIDWCRLEAIAAEAGQSVLLTVTRPR